jgi:hypothetical protein
MGYINPISIIGGDYTNAPNTLKGWGTNNAIRIAYQAKEVNSDSSIYYAGPSASDQYVIYGDGFLIGMTSVSYPFVWTAPKSGGTAALIELINGLPNRPAGVQYTTIESAMDWLVGQSENYFVISENYPWQKWTAPFVTVDAGVPQSSGFEHNWKAYDISGGGNFNYFTYGASSLTYPEGPTAYWDIANTSQGMTSQSAITIGGGNFTISVWFWATAPGAATKPILSIGDYRPPINGAALTYSSTNIGFGSGTNLTSLNINVPASINFGSWNNVLVTYNQTFNTTDVYLNGSQIASGVTNFTPGSSHIIYLGKTVDDGDGPMSGRLGMFSMSYQYVDSADASNYYNEWVSGPNLRY